MTTHRFEIVDGPSKHDLMLACFEGKRVTFSLKGANPLETWWVGVRAEDGSGNNWLLEFTSSDTKCSGYYNTVRRRVHLFTTTNVPVPKKNKDGISIREVTVDTVVLVAAVNPDEAPRLAEMFPSMAVEIAKTVPQWAAVIAVK